MLLDGERRKSACGECAESSQPLMVMPKKLFETPQKVFTRWNKTYSWHLHHRAGNGFYVRYNSTLVAWRVLLAHALPPYPLSPLYAILLCHGWHIPYFLSRMHFESFVDRGKGDNSPWPFLWGALLFTTSPYSRYSPCCCRTSYEQKCSDAAGEGYNRDLTMLLEGHSTDLIVLPYDSVLLLEGYKYKYVLLWVKVETHQDFSVGGVGAPAISLPLGFLFHGTLSCGNFYWKLTGQKPAAT